MLTYLFEASDLSLVFVCIYLGSKLLGLSHDEPHRVAFLATLCIIVNESPHCANSSVQRVHWMRRSSGDGDFGDCLARIWLAGGVDGDEALLEGLTFLVLVIRVNGVEESVEELEMSSQIVVIDRNEWCGNSGWFLVDDAD